MSSNCPLCSSKDISNSISVNRSEKSFFQKELVHQYYKCGRCKLLFVPADYHLSKDQEKARYQSHHNNSTDPGYIKFIEKLTVPLQTELSNKKPKPLIGLDFGSGESSPADRLMTTFGCSMYKYDPYFYPDLPKLDFDFIIASEVFEHLAYPAKELQLLKSILKKNGLLGVMTQLYNDDDKLDKWWYLKDETHISVYHRDTFDYISENYGFSILYCDKGVLILKSLT